MEKFCWEEKDIGFSLVCVGIFSGIVQAGFAGKIVEKLGQRGAATLGLATMTLVTIGFGLIPHGWMMYALIIPYSLTGVTDPAIRSLVSIRTPKNAQGELQGIFTSISSVAQVIGPFVLMYVYTFSKQYFLTDTLRYGSAYFTSAVIALFALIILRKTLKSKKQRNQ